MRFGIDVAQQRMPLDEVVSRVQLAEGLGFDGAWGFDHFQPMYGDGPGEAFDGVTTLAALSGVTTRIRLGLLVTGVTYRHPSVFANQMMTVDHASDGRLELSLGAAWYDKEHTELGIPFPTTGQRFDLLEDALEIMHAAHDRRADVLRRQGRVAAGRPAAPPPRAVAPPAHLDRRQRAPAHAAARRPLRGRVARLRHAQQPARDQSSASTSWPPRRAATRPTILRAGSLSLDDLDTARKHAAKWRDAGFGYLVCGWPGAGRSQVEAFAREVMPDFT